MSRICAAALVIALAACGGGSGDAPRTEDPTHPAATPTRTAPAGTLALIELGADYDQAALGTFVDADDGQDVFVGDAVRTDSTGFAEISYLDGSLTRLDVDTVFEVLELAVEPGAVRVRTRLDVGRAWHRVQQLTTDGGRFEVATSVATSSVRGTTFLIDCRQEGRCTFGVFEGTVAVLGLDGVELVVLRAGESVTVAGDRPGEFEVADAQAVEANDAWIARNRQLDDELGEGDETGVAPVPPPDGPGEIDGTLRMVGSDGATIGCPVIDTSQASYPLALPPSFRVSADTIVDRDGALVAADGDAITVGYQSYTMPDEACGFVNHKLLVTTVSRT